MSVYLPCGFTIQKWELANSQSWFTKQAVKKSENCFNSLKIGLLIKKEESLRVQYYRHNFSTFT